MSTRLNLALEWIKRIEPRVLLTVGVFALFVLTSGAVFFVWEGQKTDLRASLPADSLAVLHVRDLGRVYSGVNFESGDTRAEVREALKGVEVAFAITGFETSENEVEEGSSILNVRPTFSAVAETNAWSFQVNGFVKGPLDQFIVAQYGKGTKQETEKIGANEFVIWSAPDGRKSFASIIGSRVFFGNDRGSIEKSIAAFEGHEKSMLDDQAFSDFEAAHPESLVLGYFPRKAIEKFADVAGISAALSGSDQEGLRSFFARIVPQLTKNSVSGIYWTSNILSNGSFEDLFSIVTRASVSEVFAETMKTEGGNWTRLVDFLPVETHQLTRYRLKDPRLAYRSLLLVMANQSDPVSGQLISAFSESLLEPYGVIDAEGFLNAVGPEILTIKSRSEEDSTVVVASVKNRSAVLKSILGNRFKDEFASEEEALRKWEISDGAIAALIGSVLVIGDAELVNSSLKQTGKKARITKLGAFRSISMSEAAAASIVVDESNDAKGKQQTLVKQDSNFYFYETSFSNKSIERRYESQNGFIGSILDGLN